MGNTKNSTIADRLSSSSGIPNPVGSTPNFFHVQNRGNDGVFVPAVSKVTNNQFSRGVTHLFRTHPDTKELTAVKGNFVEISLLRAVKNVEICYVYSEGTYCE